MWPAKWFAYLLYGSFAGSMLKATNQDIMATSIVLVAYVGMCYFYSRAWNKRMKQVKKKRPLQWDDLDY